MNAPAMKDLYESASAGDTAAMVEYGRHLLFGIDCDVDTEGAVACFSQAAELGCGEAARELGYCYYCGSGIAKNDQMAAEWFRKGAELGDAEAMYKLFQNLNIGTGCSANIEEADSWLEKAKDLGYEKAQETYKAFSDGKMLSGAMKQAARQEKAENTGRLDKDFLAGSLEKLAPSTSFDLTRISVKDAGEFQIASQDYQHTSKTQTSLLMILIYIVLGAMSGYMINKFYSNGASVFDSAQFSNYLDNNVQILAYFMILGAVFGLVIGLVFSKPYKRSSVGMLFYLPVLSLPYLILKAAVPFLPYTLKVGKIVFCLFMFAITMWTSFKCYSLSWNNG